VARQLIGELRNCFCNGNRAVSYVPSRVLVEILAIFSWCTSLLCVDSIPRFDVPEINNTY
jgi:hypothetical protein